MSSRATKFRNLRGEIPSDSWLGSDHTFGKVFLVLWPRTLGLITLVHQILGTNLVETHGGVEEKSLVGEDMRRKRNPMPNMTMCGTT